MKIVATYDFNGGKNKVLNEYKQELIELENVINNIDSEQFKSKISKEKTMTGKILYSPSEINKEFKCQMNKFGWSNSIIFMEIFYQII